MVKENRRNYSCFDMLSVRLTYWFAFLWGATVSIIADSLQIRLGSPNVAYANPT